MSWATTVGVDGGQWQVMTWVMMWAIMWATGTMAATTPAKMPAKGMAGMPARRGEGGGPGGGFGGSGSGSSSSGGSSGGSCILQGSFAFHCEDIFVCGIFMCGGYWQGHTSPHTLVMLEVCRRTFGWGW
jgi:hypothetical protein